MRRVRAQRVGTLGDLVRQQTELYLVCMTTGCTAEDRKIDIEAAIARHGDMPLQRYAERSRCRICGAYEPRTVCPPIVVPMSAAWDRAQRGERDD